jgi:hypothetical protein
MLCALSSRVAFWSKSASENCAGALSHIDQFRADSAFGWRDSPRRVPLSQLRRQSCAHRRRLMVIDAEIHKEQIYGRGVSNPPCARGSNPYRKVSVTYMCETLRVHDRVCANVSQFISRGTPTTGVSKKRPVEHSGEPMRGGCRYTIGGIRLRRSPTDTEGALAEVGQSHAVDGARKRHAE